MNSSACSSAQRSRPDPRSASSASNRRGLSPRGRLRRSCQRRSASSTTDGARMVAMRFVEAKREGYRSDIAPAF